MTAISAAVAIAKNASAVLELLDMFDEFATDIALEVGGAWVPYKNGTRFKIARAGNDAYNEALNKVMDENREALLLNDTAAKDLSERLMCEIVADTILKGWETVQGEQTLNHIKYKGQTLPYSREAAITLLSHGDFRNWVKRQSDNREYFKAKLVEEAAKN